MEKFNVKFVFGTENFDDAVSKSLDIIINEGLFDKESN
jgi:hypothetical protein